MSIHRNDLEQLLDSYAKHLGRSNMSAINLIPHLITALVAYVDDRLNGAPAHTDAPAVEDKVAALPVAQPTGLSETDKAFAVATIAQHLEEHGNATVETDQGSLKVEAKDLVDAAVSAGIDLNKEVANAVVDAIEQEGAREILAVSAKVATDVASGETPEEIAVDAGTTAAATLVEDAVETASKPKRTPKK